MPIEDVLSDILNISSRITVKTCSASWVHRRELGEAAECCNAASAFFILRIESAEMALTLSEFMCDTCSLSKSF